MSHTTLFGASIGETGATGIGSESHCRYVTCSLTRHIGAVFHHSWTSVIVVIVLAGMVVPLGSQLLVPRLVIPPTPVPRVNVTAGRPHSYRQA